MAEYVICVFGSGGVGKSCITIQFVQGIFMPKYDPTIEDVYKTTIEIDEKQYSLEILDTAGSEEFSSMRDLYIKNGHGFVLVYSITSQATFNDIQTYYNRIISVKDIDTHGPPSVILVGNKCDIEDERVVSRETGQSLARKWNCTFLEASAKHRTNITEIFNDLVRQVNRKTHPPSHTHPTTKKNDSTDAYVQIHSDKDKSQSTISNDHKKRRCCVLL